jgi:threonine dehydratase
VKDGRLIRLRFRVPDFPGALHGLTGIVSGSRANILRIEHDRAYHGVLLGQTMVEMTLETRGREHLDELVSRLEEAGYTFERVT